MKKKVAIGIPAYNEENNIYYLLTDLLKQKQTFFEIKEILVASDGSTDNTIKEIKRIDDCRIKIISNNERLGKVRRLNQMYSRFNHEIFLQFDADIKIYDRNLLNKLVAPFIINPSLDVVYGMQMPLNPQTLIGKLAHFGFNSWEKTKSLTLKNTERYNCFGQITAFSSQFLKSYRIPDDKYVTEDTYSFYFAKKNGYTTIFQQNAIVYFKLPQNLQDYMHQMSRYISTNSDMADFFGKTLTTKYETLTELDKIKGMLANIRPGNVQYAVLYVVLQLSTRLQTALSKQKVEWVTISSSK